MDSMDVNKGVAAVLVAGIAFMISGLVGQGLVHPTALKQSAIKLEAPAGAGAPAAAPAGPGPIGVLLASANVEAGEAATKKLGCVACHSFNEGGKAGVGPNLYGVVGAPHGHMDGYAYSAALKAKQGPWTFAALNEWLYKPAAYAPGTKMTYAGVADDKVRGDVIAYLRSLSKSPEPLPAVEKVSAPATGSAPAASAGGAPAGGEQPIETLLASADPKAGQADTLKLGCIACHSFNQGGKAGLGPNLYGVVGGPHGHMEGYAYSAALKAHDGPWTFAELNKWLTKPSAYAPGTKMTYAGITDARTRADVIAYLDTLAEKPEPLPGKTEAAPATTAPKP